MKRLRALPVLLWLLGLALCAGVALRAHYTADMSAFLPRSPTPAQQLLVDQLTEGVLSRLLLVGIEGNTPSGRAELSRSLAKRRHPRRNLSLSLPLAPQPAPPPRSAPTCWSAPA